MTKFHPWYPVANERFWIAPWGFLSESEAQSKAWELWQSLSFSQQKAIERSGVDGHVALHSGVAGLVALRDALEAVSVAA